MPEQVRDALRHLEKDMSEILDILKDKNTTEIILNPYLKKNGNYEGHILIDKHGCGLHNLIKQLPAKVEPVTLAIGDIVIYKYSSSSSTSVLYWSRPLALSLANLCKHIAICIRNTICDDYIAQTTDFSLLEYATAIEEGDAGGIELSEEMSQNLDNLLNLMNQYLPPSAAFTLDYAVIERSNIQQFQAYPSKLIKSELVKMTATKAETIMSVLASITGKYIHNKSPRLECQIPKYGHRFTGVIPPAVKFPAFCIRKHAAKIYTLDDFVTQGVLQQTSCDTVISWIKRRFNILIAGGTGSGKTTLANAILYEIAKIYPDNRILIIEDVPELQFNTSRSIGLTIGEFFSMYDALRTTLRFKPDRIVMGEIRGAEAYTLLKAWNTGHPGGVATIHANGVNEALYRFESCVRDYPEVKLNRQEIGFTINGIISIQNITVKEEQNGEYLNVVKRKVTALRQIIHYDPEKDIYQDVIYDKVEDSFDELC